MKKNPDQHIQKQLQNSDINDEGENGRILTDSEFTQALHGRPDIFHFEKEKRLHVFEVAAIALGVVVGVWLSAAPVAYVHADFRQKILKMRIAKLIRAEDAPAIPQTKAVAVSRNEKKRGTLVTDVNRHVKETLTAQNTAHKEIPTTDTTGERGARDSVAAGGRAAVQQNSVETVANDSALFQQADLNKKRQDYGKAIDGYRYILRHNPHDTRALAGLGDSYSYAGLMDSAAVYYYAALAENPHIPTAHNGLATVHYYEAVSPAFTTETMAWKKSAAYAKMQYDSAIAEYTSAIALDSTYVDALTNRGVLRDIHNDHQGALTDYTRAIKINPAGADAYAKRAATYKTLGKYKEALADYTAAIKRDSSSYEFGPTQHFANAFFGRGNIRYKMGNLAKAIADYDSTLLLYPHHSLAMLNKAIALGDAQQYDSAIACFTKAISWLSPMEYNGAQERGLCGRGMMYNLTDRFQLALADFNEALRLNPRDYYAYLHRGNAYKELGKVDAAIADYSQALNAPALAAKACRRIAECYELKHDPKTARQWMKKSADRQR